MRLPPQQPTGRGSNALRADRGRHRKPGQLGVRPRESGVAGQSRAVHPRRTSGNRARDTPRAGQHLAARPESSELATCLPRSSSSALTSLPSFLGSSNHSLNEPVSGEIRQIDSPSSRGWPPAGPLTRQLACAAMEGRQPALSVFPGGETGDEQGQRSRERGPGWCARVHARSLGRFKSSNAGRQGRHAQSPFASYHATELARETSRHPDHTRGSPDEHVANIARRSAETRARLEFRAFFRYNSSCISNGSSPVPTCLPGQGGSRKRMRPEVIPATKRDSDDPPDFGGFCVSRQREPCTA